MDSVNKLYFHQLTCLQLIESTISRNTSLLHCDQLRAECFVAFHSTASCSWVSGIAPILLLRELLYDEGNNKTTSTMSAVVLNCQTTRIWNNIISKKKHISMTQRIYKTTNTSMSTNKRFESTKVWKQDNTKKLKSRTSKKGKIRNSKSIKQQNVRNNDNAKQRKC